MTQDSGPVRFLLCVTADGYPASLEVRKVYRAIPDPAAEVKGFVRIVDESGEDYLYPQRFFVAIEVPATAAESLLASSARDAT
jgi:hypothetical protein